MALTKLTTDLNNIQALNDEPNDVTGLTAAQVKAVFDEAGNEIKTYINDTLTAEIDVLPASSISVVPIPTLTGTEVQTVLESVKTRIDTIAVSNANAEIADTHVGADARTYATLSERLNTIDALDVTQALLTDLTTINADVTALEVDVTVIDNTTYKKTDWTSGTNWLQMPNGEIHQWGTVVTPNASAETDVGSGFWYSVVLLNFPKPFVTACYSITAFQSNNVRCWVSSYGTPSKTGSAVYLLGISSTVTKGKTCSWYAIGK